MTPQAAQAVSPVRHAMVALASLWEMVYEAGRDVSGSGQPKTLNTFALRRYHAAISEMRQSLQGTHRPFPEETLMSNVLFICIEVLQGYRESSISQLSSGLYMFCDWQASQRRQDSAEASQRAKSCTELRHIYVVCSQG